MKKYELSTLILSVLGMYFILKTGNFGYSILSAPMVIVLEYKILDRYLDRICDWFSSEL